MSKPTSTTYTKIVKPGGFGSFQWQQMTIAWQDATQTWDSAGNVYTNIPKPSTQSYTKISKPT